MICSKGCRFSVLTGAISGLTAHRSKAQFRALIGCLSTWGLSALCFCPNNVFQQWLQKTFLLAWKQTKSFYNMDKNFTGIPYSGCSSDNLNTSTVLSQSSSWVPCPVLCLSRVEARAFPAFVIYLCVYLFTYFTRDIYKIDFPCW